MRFAPRAINSSSTGGLSDLELIGARKACDQLLSAAGDGGIVYYGVEAQNADEWEEGIGVVIAGAPPILQRHAVIESSNADDFVDFTPGPKLVFITSPSIVQAAAHLHKPPCRVAVTTNVNLASGLANGSSAGGVTLATGDRVLLVGQTDPIQNGPWLSPATGAATRPLDFYTGDTCRGSIVGILEGSRAGETYLCTATAAAVIGTDAQTWVSVLTSWSGSTSITTLGTITTGVWNGTTIAVANGGTGATTAAGARSNLGVTATGADTTYAYRANNLSDLANAGTARTNLGLGTIATQAASSVTITGGSITGITDLAVADGGTGASTAANARTNLGVTATGSDTTYAYRANNLSDLANAGTARTNLGLAIGTDVQAYHANLAAIAAGTWTGAASITTLGTITTGTWTGTAVAVANGGTGATSAGSARTNLGAAASGAATASGLTMATARLLGRTTASSGAVEEISVAGSLTLSAGTLTGTADASTNTATSVDSEVALFSGTGGKTLKRASGSGLAKLTSGVLSTATAGTDYYAPGSTDVAIADGGTGQSTAYAGLDALTLKGSNIASASNVNLGAATGLMVDVTNSGTTTIVSFQTANAGVVRVVRFAASLTITHNATSLILPGGRDITTSSNDVGIFQSLGSGNWQMIGYVRADDNVTHRTVTGLEPTTGSGNGGLVATTATAGGNAGIRLASGGTDRFQIGCIGSAGSTSMRFYCYEPGGEGFRIDPNRNLALGSTAAPSAGTSCLILGVAGTALTPHSSQCGLYGETISSTTELRAVDGAANRVTLTPHPPAVLDTHDARLRDVQLDPLLAPWGYRSENPFLGVETLGDVAAALRCVEYLMNAAGRPISLVWERPLPGGPELSWDDRQRNCVQKWDVEARAHDEALARWAAQPFWIRDTVSRRPLAIGPRPEANEPPLWLAERLTQSKV